ALIGAERKRSNTASTTAVAATRLALARRLMNDLRGSYTRTISPLRGAAGACRVWPAREERDESDRLRRNRWSRGPDTGGRAAADGAPRLGTDQEPRDRRELRRHALPPGALYGEAQAPGHPRNGGGGRGGDGRRGRDERAPGDARRRLHEPRVCGVLRVAVLHGHPAPRLRELRRRRRVPDPGPDRIPPPAHGR